MNGDPNRDYGQEWKAWRLARGWSKVQAAEALDMKSSAIAKIESGKCRPTRLSREKLEALQKRYAEASL